MSRTVAVTGATGFIGSHLAARLARHGWRVRALARRPEAAADLRRTGVDVVSGSLEDAESLRRLVGDAEAVVHLAGLTKARGRAEFFRINAEGTRHLVAALGRRRGLRLVQVSSLAARAPHLSAYAASKRAGEEAVAASEGLHWAILRPPAVYGPGDREILPFFRAVARGIGPMTGRRDARLSLIHVEDLAAAVEAALALPDSGHILELHDGRTGGYSWPELVEAAGAALGRRPLRLRVPAPVLGAVAAAGAARAALTGRPVMLTPDKLREVLHADWVVRDDRLESLTGWRAKFSIGEGFRQTVLWYRQQHWL